VAEDPKQDVLVTPGLPQQVLQQGAVTEEKIEYRDEDGNLLDEEQVKALQGKVSFTTRYETRTRLVDAAGKEIYNEVVGGGGEDEGEVRVAGTLAEGPDPVTSGSSGEASTQPPRVDVEADLAKEESVEGASATAEPEGRDEL